ncbi:MAG TPA: FG-GAP-like repeat-containing protein [Pseudomonadota bacterium]|nr:FG-GAP-like repeat-containing protein [Pseudomonadota bacterium]
MKTPKTAIPQLRSYLAARSLLFVLGGAVASCSNPSDSLIPNDMGGVGNISITSVSPAVVGIAGGTPVAVYGTGFAAGATVAFGNKLATQVQVISSTQIQMLAPAAENGPGAVPVTVRNADGSFAVATGLFRYVRVVLDFDNTRVPVGTQPVAVIAEDTNGDGNPEIITANDGTANVSVLPANLNYQNGSTYPTPVGPTALVVADFNGNRIPDIAIACNNGSAQDLAILSGNGGGGFMSPVTFTVGRNPTAIASRDLDGDGKPDIVMAPRTGDTVYVLRNTSVTPGIAFTTGATYNLKASSAPSALLLDDLTGDAYPELVTGNYSDASISTFIGNSGGIFSGPKNTTVVAQVLSLAAGDLTGDGKKDVATLSYGGRSISILKGKGDGTFDPGDTLSTEKDPRMLAIADVDGDGKLDLVVANSGTDSVGIYLGNGSGGFDAAQTITVGSTPYALVIKDLNLDGKPDIVTANFNSNDVSILRNKTQR